MRIKKNSQSRGHFVNSFELLLALKKNGYLQRLRDPLWWPRSGTFWVIVGAILTQQTKWEKVEKSIENLEKAGIDSLEKIIKLESEHLALLIKPSGFYNTKAKNLQRLSCSIINTFDNFETFCIQVERAWLLAQKGIGQESADSILCYACAKETMVVDAYTQRLLSALGYDFESYISIQEWIVEGIVEHKKKIDMLYGREMSLHEIYALFHGKIVEFCKCNSKGKEVNVESLGI